MPFPSAVIEDLNDFPIFTQTQLLVDVALTPVNTQTDVMTFGTLQPGTYMLSAYVTIAQITNTAVTTLKFLAGATVIAAIEATWIVGAGAMCIGPFPVVLGAAAIVKLVGFSTVVTTTVKSVALNNAVGTQNFASNITALRIA